MTYTESEYKTIKRFLTSRLMYTDKGIDNGRYNMCTCCNALTFTPDVVVSGFKSKQQAKEFKDWLDNQDQDLDEYLDSNDIERISYKSKVVEVEAKAKAKPTMKTFDCIDEEGLICKDFPEATKLNFKVFKQTDLGTLWDLLVEIGVDDFTQEQKHVRVTNLLINGKRWNFTVKFMKKVPAIDYSSYGKWYADEIEITDKEMV